MAVKARCRVQWCQNDPEPEEDRKDMMVPPPWGVGDACVCILLQLGRSRP